MLTKIQKKGKGFKITPLLSNSAQLLDGNGVRNDFRDLPSNSANGKQQANRDLCRPY